MGEFFNKFWRGLRWLFGAIVALVAFSKERREIVKELQVQEFQNAVTIVWQKIAQITLWDAILWLIAIGLVTFLVWILHTKPRRRIVEEFDDDLERRRPGLSKRKRRRRRGRSNDHY